MNKVDDIKPTISGIGRNLGVYGTSTKTYNEAGQSYNQASQIYGGADVVTSTGPTVISLLNFIPTASDVVTVQSTTYGGRNKGVYGSTTTTYNQAGFSFNQVGQIYGGGDFVNDIGPTFIGIGVIDSAIPAPGNNAGQPIGLLLALTYP